jgi:crotonobetainyl-CoA:carnitine CoA-transferase CaiB-like acyl-CoA transferase
MANDEHPILDALFVGMEEGVDISANTLLKHLKAQQEKSLQEDADSPEAAKRAAHIAKLEALCAEISAERAKREAQKTVQPKAAPEEAPNTLKPWWKDVLNKTNS